ncbi:MAG: hypothetical protein FPO08_00500 [Geobacter sp.]|nr:MAG: hypothetical protein FPO08_00500 [Geobacter sp.]
MQLAIVLSKNGAGEARITSTSGVDEIVHFLSVFGVSGWNLYDKGTARLESNGPDLYIAIGPVNSQDVKDFLKQIPLVIDA